ncbi:polysaccharide lyase family 8 super-sandwich domain-containing protein [Paenibacillus illinoisensis]|uniref:Polysaccharide lyase family 8 super-sandwich domain-containing protein n=1 Tax=Paenibacillus illinoisensis TaxID=59845 RepID=A0ABW8HWK4_9BACL
MQVYNQAFIKAFFFRLIIMLLVLSLIIPAVALPPAFAAGTVYVNVNYDESGNAKNTKLYNGSTYSGSVGGGWGIYNSSAETDYVTIENAPQREDYSLKIVSNTKNVSTGRNNLGGTVAGNTGIAGKLVFEASVYMNSTTHRREIQFRSLNAPYPATSTTNVSALTFNTAGEIRDASNQLLAHYEKNSWYNIKMFIDNSARSISYFLNDQYLGEASLSSVWLNIRHIYLHQYFQSGLQAEWMVDDLKLANYVPLTGIRSSVAMLELPESASTNIAVTLLPQDASDQRLLWSTDDPDVATVTNGTVYALKEGSTTVNVSTYEGNYSLAVPVTVTKPVLPLGIILPDEVNLAVTSTQVLKPVFNPHNTTNQALDWSSNNPAVATVNAVGEITGISVGSTVISAVSQADSTISAEVTVIVTPYIPVNSVTITHPPSQISKYDSLQLTANVEPANATDSELSWVSDHPEIVSVTADGTIQALAVGTATVSASTVNGVADSVTLEVVAPQPENPEEYDEIRLRWKETLIGKDSLDVNDAAVQAIIEANASAAQQYWESMQLASGGTTLWNDLPASASDSTFINNHYTRLKTMALAYQTKGTSLYHNSGLKDDLLQAMNWMLDELYTDTGTEFGNWWNWDIGVPNRLADILILMYDDLTPEQILRNTASIDHYIGDITAASFTQTGANRSDIMLIQVRMGLVEHNYDRLIQARNGMSELFQYTAAGDGFYEDGSYVQHSTIAYTGSYGEVLIQGMGNLLFLLNGSTWEPVVPEMNNVYRWIDEGFAPILYKGQAIDMTRGRAIVRPAGDAYYSGRNILVGIARIALTSPAELSLKLKSLVKYHVEYQLSRGVTYYQFPLDLADTIRHWVEDPAIVPASEIQAHYELNGMARSVHWGEDFLFGVSKSSKRIATYELTNGENPKGWYTGDGMTYLYNQDLSQYSGSFWATVNWNRLPGTTVVSRTRNSSNYQNGDGETVPLNSWAGGTTLDSFGVTGIELIQSGTQMQARKSWFAFDNEIVALGAGIVSTDNLPVETVIEQRKLKEDNSNSFFLDGEALNGIIENEDIESPSWAYLEGNVTDSNIGYIFPDHSSIKLTRQIQEGRWSDINLSNPPSATSPTDLLQNYFLTMWIDHGDNPADSKYEYMILPNASKQETKDYADSPDVTILANSQTVQAVRENTLDVAGYNFWADTLTSAGGVTSNKQASVMIRNIPEADTIELAVSDPTLENQGYIELELDADAAGILGKDDRIEVLQLSPTVKLKINMRDTLGQTLLITLQTQLEP